MEMALKLVLEFPCLPLLVTFTYLLRKAMLAQFCQNVSKREVLKEMVFKIWEENIQVH